MPLTSESGPARSYFGAGCRAARCAHHVGGIPKSVSRYSGAHLLGPVKPADLRRVVHIDHLRTPEVPRRQTTGSSTWSGGPPKVGNLRPSPADHFHRSLTSFPGVRATLRRSGCKTGGWSLGASLGG